MHCSVTVQETQCLVGVLSRKTRDPINDLELSKAAVLLNSRYELVSSFDARSLKAPCSRKKLYYI